MRNVHSSPGGPTAAFERPPPLTTRVVEPETIALSGPRILVVDDDDVYRGLYEAVLSLAGYETLSVSSGDEALAALDTTIFDLLVTDDNKPFLDGWQLIRDLRSNRCDIPIMLIATPIQNGEELPEDIRCDVAAALPRPARMCDLLSSVAHSLGAREPTPLKNHTL